MKKTREQKIFCRCVGSNKDGTFTFQEKLLLNTIQLIAHQQPEGYERVVKIQESMKGISTDTKKEHATLSYHLFWLPVNYTEILKK